MLAPVWCHGPDQIRPKQRRLKEEASQRRGERPASLGMVKGGGYLRALAFNHAQRDAHEVETSIGVLSRGQLRLPIHKEC